MGSHLVGKQETSKAQCPGAGQFEHSSLFGPYLSDGWSKLGKLVLPGNTQFGGLNREIWPSKVRAAARD